MRIWSQFAWGQTNQEPGAGTSVYISQPTSGSVSPPSLSTKDWRLCFPGWSWNWNTEEVLPETLKKPRQSRAGRVEQTGLYRAEQSWRGAHLRAALPQVCLIARLFHSQALLTSHYITIELFALNKVSLFTTPQAEYSCWCWIGINTIGRQAPP